jgi:tetratricopeptide (TPR) repeat protein
MKNAPVILLAFAALCYSGPCAPGQELQLLDIPGSGRVPDVTQDLPVGSEVRSALQKALNARDFTGAETILVKEIDHNRKSAQLLTLAGSVFFLDGKYLNSAIALKKAEALAPLDDRNRFTLAMAYITLNHRDWARPELEKLTRSDPRNALYPYWLSRLDYDAMHFESAVSHAQKALELNANFMKGYDELGLCYEALGKYEEAAEAYRNAVRLNERDLPCSPWPAQDLGALLIKLDRLGEAEESLNKSLRCDARFPRAHYQMGILLEKQKKSDHAVEELQQAAALDPNYPEPYYILGQIYQRQGQSQKAAAAWATFQKLKKAESRERPH